MHLKFLISSAISLCNNFLILITARCNKPLDYGFGALQLPVFYYNAEDNTCRSFKFNGVGGNENRFTSFEECKEACYIDEEAKRGII